jgi:hypothetical protein
VTKKPSKKKTRRAKMPKKPSKSKGYGMKSGKKC